MRQDAPGELEVVRGFVNTWDLEAATDALSSPRALAAWLADHGLAPRSGLAPTEGDLRRAVELREALRALAIAHAGGAEPPEHAARLLAEVAERAEIGLRFSPAAEPVLEPRAGGVDGALGRLVAIVARAVEDGRWLRLKACPASDCHWAFYDHSKGRLGRWCQMAECGNRAKARAYRERTRERDEGRRRARDRQPPVSPS